MAVRIDQDAIVKYADKVILGLAVAFLAYAAISIALGGSKPEVTYKDVVRAYEDAQQRSKDADDNLKALLGLPDDVNTADASQAADVQVYRMLEGVRTRQQPEYAADFEKAHRTQPAEWANRSRWAPYVAARIQEGETIPPWDLPSKRIAPAMLLCVQDKGYRPTGKEKQREFGQDILYVAGQARVPRWQQTLWSREAAPGATINSTLLTDYEVQRQELKPDGTWTEWQDVRTVASTDVKKQPALVRPRDGDPATLDPDEKLRKQFLDMAARYRSWLEKSQTQDDLLRPPFFDLAGKDWYSPYDKLKIAELAPGGAVPGGNVAPVAPAPPAWGGPTPGGAAAPWGAGAAAAPAVGQRDETEIWFNDVFSPNDAGKTFRYRMRVKFFNPILGTDHPIRNPADRYRLELAGQWGDPSAPITLQPVVMFYFVGRFGDKVNVEFHRWWHGTWYRARGVTFDIGDILVTERNEQIVIPDKKGDITLPTRERVLYDVGASAVDVMDASLRVNSVVQNTEKLIYRDQHGSALEARLAWTDRNRVGQHWDEVQKERTVVTPKRRLPVAPVPVPPEGEPVPDTVPMPEGWEYAPGSGQPPPPPPELRRDR